MDLAAGARNLFIAMEHTTNSGEIRIVEDLTYPATGVGKVRKVFTDLAVMEVTPEGLVLEEYYPGVSPDEIQSVTGAKLIFSPSLKEN